MFGHSGGRTSSSVPGSRQAAQTFCSSTLPGQCLTPQHGVREATDVAQGCDTSGFWQQHAPWWHSRRRCALQCCLALAQDQVARCSQPAQAAQARLDPGILQVELQAGSMHMMHIAVPQPEQGLHADPSLHTPKDRTLLTHLQPLDATDADASVTHRHASLGQNRTGAATDCVRNIDAAFASQHARQHPGKQRCAQQQHVQENGAHGRGPGPLQHARKSPSAQHASTKPLQISQAEAAEYVPPPQVHHQQNGPAKLPQTPLQSPAVGVFESILRPRQARRRSSTVSLSMSANTGSRSGTRSLHGSNAGMAACVLSEFDMMPAAQAVSVDVPDVPPSLLPPPLRQTLLMRNNSASNRTGLLLAGGGSQFSLGANGSALSKPSQVGVSGLKKGHQPRGSSYNGGALQYGWRSSEPNSMSRSTTSSGSKQVGSTGAHSSVSAQQQGAGLSVMPLPKHLDDGTSAGTAQASGPDQQVAYAAGMLRPWPRVRLRQQQRKLQRLWTQQTGQMPKRRKRHRYRLPRLAPADVPARKIFRRTVSRTSQLCTTHASPELEVARGCAAPEQQQQPSGSSSHVQQVVSMQPTRISYTVYCHAHEDLRYVQYSVDAGYTWRYAPAMPLTMQDPDGQPQHMLVASVRVALKARQPDTSQEAGLGTVLSEHAVIAGASSTLEPGVAARGPVSQITRSPCVWVRMHPGPQRTPLNAPGTGQQAASHAGKLLPWQPLVQPGKYLLCSTGTACGLMLAPITLVCDASSLAGAGALHAGAAGMRSALSQSAGPSKPNARLNRIGTGSKLGVMAARRDVSGVAAVAAAWAASRQLSCAGLLMVNTSRSFASFLQLQRDCEGALPDADVLITGMGTQIRYRTEQGWLVDTDWEQCLDASWDSDAVAAAVQAITAKHLIPAARDSNVIAGQQPAQQATAAGAFNQKGLAAGALVKLAPAKEQGQHRVSLLIKQCAIAPVLQQLTKHLVEASMASSSMQSQLPGSAALHAGMQTLKQPASHPRQGQEQPPVAARASLGHGNGAAGPIGNGERSVDARHAGSSIPPAGRSNQRFNQCSKYTKTASTTACYQTVVRPGVRNGWVRLDILPSLAGKAAAFQRVLSRFGVPASTVVGVGDSAVDAGMLAVCGKAVVTHPRPPPALGQLLVARAPASAGSRAGLVASQPPQVLTAALSPSTANTLLPHRSLSSRAQTAVSGGRGGREGPQDATVGAGASMSKSAGRAAGPARAVCTSFGPAGILQGMRLLGLM